MKSLTEVEVVAKAERRQFTADYKLKVLREADDCSPYVIEHIERHFFRSFSIRGYPHDQRKNDSMRLLVKGMQCTLVTAGDGSDEL